MDVHHDLVHTLLGCDVFKVGNFKLKSGSLSPIYIDLRQIINFPHVIRDLANAIRTKQTDENLKSDVVCGVPYTALPIASVFSVLYNVPMVIKRKERKDYGTKKMVEGNIIPGSRCLIIEDIISSGTSIIETASELRKEGLVVEECIVVIDRKQGGVENLKKSGIKLYPLFNINMIFDAYSSLNRVETQLAEQVKSYFRDNSYLPVVKSKPHSKLTLSERAKASTHPVAKKLFEVIEKKKSNLCVAVDADSSDVLLDLANRLGPFICVLKTHIDILNDFSQNVILRLKELAKHHNFLIMEDRKFADIGNTVIHQFRKGIYKIQTWADLVTVHGIPGKGIIDALADEKCASVLIAEMSSEGALTDEDFKQKVFEMAENNTDSVVGYVAQKSHSKGNFIHMCPGVNITSTSDSFGQQYKSPEEAIANGADIIIVGRGICNAADVEASAADYRSRSFDAYMKCILG